ncbi:5-(carboxyamino)imidazole ribonucleotide mutase [uncultured Secundilactobacillus sp.]|uniref:5-(carboxyamino)imidazole ribonucleotide mutase n=1 Tax=uncultured Secundilactobacillus sp. TaxID=2813935 RepID=UPI00258542E9|nr:5-(carboxyamino)imidazole ribonucleotide mutase [uncultured Secundilactobacillus sp.]
MQVAVVMGSKSDWPIMQETSALLDQLGVTYTVQVISAHRMPRELQQFSETAKDEHYQVVIAGAGGAAHLPGMIAANTTLPVIGVPIQTKALNGLDSLLSIVQMPAGVPVATVAIGNAGAKNAAILAAEIVALRDSKVNQRLAEYRSAQTKEAIASNATLE